MGLSKLLAVGRSVRTIKDGPARYRMTQQNLLPKFSGEKAPEPRAAAELPPPVEAPSQPAPAENAVPAAATPELGGEESEPGPAKLAAFVEATKTLRPFGGWSWLRNPFERWVSRKAGTAPLQTELSLDSVKPMRNDLIDRA